jgi:iron complex outermembrane recepter protein
MKVLKLFFVSVLLFSPGLAYASINLDDIVVTPSRMAQRNYKVASNVTVIDTQQIEDSGAQTVVDILRETMAVNVYDKGSAKVSTVDIRGFADTAVNNILVLVDDRKVNSIDISGPDLLQIPINSVERIEILRGAGSVLYGDNAVGGVINIITKKGKGDFKGRVGTTYGSYDSRSVDVEGSGSKNDFSYYLYSKYDDARGYRQNSDSLRKDFNTKVGYTLTDRLAADVDVKWHEDKQELPGGLSGSEIARFSRRHSMVGDDFVDTKDRMFTMGLDVKPWPEDIEWGRFLVDFSYRNRDVYDAFFEFGEFSTKRNVDTYGVTTKYVFDHEVFNHDVNFVTGVDYYDTKNDILGSGSNADDVTIKKKEIGAFGYAQYETLKDVFINLGTRYNKAWYDFDQRNVVVDVSQEPDIWVSSAGARYDYAPGSNIHASAQETFRFLATDEWYSTGAPAFGINPLLNIYMDQQRGTQLETGIKHNLNNGVVGTLTLYQIDLDNEIFFDPSASANSNYDQTRRRGIEVGQETDVLKFLPVESLDEFEFLTSYNYLDARFIDGSFDDQRVPMVARSQVNAGIVLGFLKNYKASLMGRYIGARYPINDQANVWPQLKPYYVMDTKLTYERGPLEVFMAVNNVFDKKYDSYSVVFGSFRDFFPASERNFTAGMNVKF